MKKSIFKTVVILIFVVLFSTIFLGAQRPNDFDDLKIEYDLPIIMYHATHKGKPAKYNLPPDALEKDFVYILECGYTPIFIKDLINFTENDKPLPPKPIMITFDDAYTNNYLYAWPIIKKHQIKCVMSVVGKFIDDNYKEGKLCPTGSHLTYEEIDELNKSGIVEIQNHTYNCHGKSGRVGLAKKKRESYEEYEKTISNDLMLLQNKLKEKLNINCTAVTYPFGSCSKETEKVIKKLGFKAALTCAEGTNKIKQGANLFCLKRYNRPGGKTAEAFFGKIGVK